MKERLKSAICVLCIFLTLSMSAYINTYYRASDDAVKSAENVGKWNSNILFFGPKDEAECGLIFYPGGKVEHIAYAPLMEACARKGILCVLIKMPCNLAVLDINAADGIQEQFPYIKEWYMAGHSLGGSMAASHISEHVEDFKGLILLAAYSTEDLSDTGLEVLSVYGTEDQILNKEKYIKYKDNLPTDYIEAVIEGGCHAYFGNYGEQEGDGMANISVEEQQKTTVKAIMNFVE